jgi:hypothetical protein
MPVQEFLLESALGFRGSDMLGAFFKKLRLVDPTWGDCQPQYEAVRDCT